VTKRRSTPLTQEDIGKLIGLFAVLLGGFLYLYPPYLAGFPINDGGLFYAMMRAIQANAYRLPATVEYNGLSIPFAYPPLALYVGAAMSSLLHVDPIVILQWLPAIVLIGISVAFYFLAARLLDSPIEAGISTFLYVCAPRSMTWLVMGGGLTRSFGQLFMLLTVFFVFSLYTRRERKFIVWSIVTGSLVLLAHPEAALQAVAACVILWIIKGRDRQAGQDSLRVGLGIAMVTALWWAPVLLRHGLAPFLSAGGTGFQFSATLIAPLMMTFTEEPMMSLIAVFSLVGAAACIARRLYFLPAWLVLPFIVDPRSAATVAIVPMVLMAAIALHEVILPAVATLRPGPGDIELAGPYHNTAGRLLIAYLGLYVLIMAMYAGMNLARVTVSPDNRTSLNWVARNTPRDSSFLIMTGDQELFCDPIQEWFPVLAGRKSASTIQGNEWRRNGRFFERAAGLQELQRCLTASAPSACLRAASSELGLEFDHIYVAKVSPAARGCRAGTEQRRGDNLVAQLAADGDYVSVYRTEAVEILAAPR